MIHLDLVVPDGTVISHAILRDAIPRRDDEVRVRNGETYRVRDVAWNFCAVGEPLDGAPDSRASHTHVLVYLEDPADG